MTIFCQQMYENCLYASLVTMIRFTNDERWFTICTWKTL